MYDKQAEFPILSRLHEAYNDLQAFQDAAPENQPDAPDSSKWESYVTH